MKSLLLSEDEIIDLVILIQRELHFLENSCKDDTNNIDKFIAIREKLKKAFASDDV